MSISIKINNHYYTIIINETIAISVPKQVITMINTRHAIAAHLDQRLCNEPHAQYREDGSSWRKWKEEGNIHEVPEGIPLETILEETFPLLRDGKVDGTVQQPVVVIVQDSYRVPMGEYERILGEWIQNAYHPAHSKKFVTMALAQKTNSAEGRAATKFNREQYGICPGDVMPFAIKFATPFPEEGTGGLRRGTPPGTPRPKVGGGFLGDHGDFVLYPYASLVSAVRMLAQMFTNNDRLRYGTIRLNDEYTGRQENGLFTLVTEITAEQGSTSAPPEGFYTSTLENLAVSRSKPSRSKLVQAAWTLTADTTCEDSVKLGKRNRYQGKTRAHEEKRSYKISKHDGLAWYANPLLLAETGYGQPWASSIPIPTNFTMRKAHELSTRVLIRRSDGDLQGLNRTELSFFLAAYEQFLIQKMGMPADIMFSYEPPTIETCRRLIDVGTRYHGRIFLPGKQT
jgi:hypothetical protein